MNGRPTDADFDRLLVDWLAGGPSRSPDWVATGAIDQVEAVAQKPASLWRAPRFRLVRDRRLALAFSLVALAGLAVAIGVGIGRQSLKPEPSPTFDAGRTLLNPRDGSFAISLPAGWTQTSGADRSAIYVENDATGIQLSIRRGNASGLIRRCDIPIRRWELCDPVAASTLDRLVSVVTPRSRLLIPGQGLPQVGQSPTIVDGEPATWVSILNGGLVGPVGPNVVYTAVIHDGRPYLIRSTSELDKELAELRTAATGLRFERRPGDPDESTERGLRTVSYPDLGIEFAIPSAWHETGSSCCGQVSYRGDQPEGRMSISYRTPFQATYCINGCMATNVEPMIPFDPAAVIDEMESDIRTTIGSGTWLPLPRGAVPGLANGRRLSRDVRDGDGVSRSETYVLGQHENRVVLFAWSQRTDASQLNMVDRVLSSIRLVATSQDQVGALREFSSPRDYSIALPDLWLPGQEFAIQSALPIDVRRFGDGSVTIGIGSLTGTIGICDPACRVVSGQQSMDALRKTLAPDGTIWVPSQRDVAGITATVLRSPSGTEPDLEHIFFFDRFEFDRDARPVVITINHTGWRVSQESYDQMINSFGLEPRVGPATTSLTLTAPDGSFRVDLPNQWNEGSGDDPTTVFAWRGAPSEATRLSVRRGDESGRIRPCSQSVSGWETCEPVTIRSLDDARRALQLTPTSYSPSTVYEDVVLDGEPALLLYSVGYQYPARGGQSLVYIAAVHAGRPYVIRLWTGAEIGLVGVRDVIDGFHFID